MNALHSQTGTRGQDAEACSRREGLTLPRGQLPGQAPGTRRALPRCLYSPPAGRGWPGKGTRPRARRWWEGPPLLAPTGFQTRGTRENHRGLPVPRTTLSLGVRLYRARGFLFERKERT